ncbi:MAG TPA: NYN domain-containing protein [Myxococcota bacterium]|nr:NYN domain-containing protein [Myxococcota bacterium]
MWLVDGYNVLHAGVLRGRDRREWWTAAVQQRVVDVAETFDDPRAEIWVVFDDARPGRSERCREPEPPSRVRLAYAPSADDWLVKRVRSASDPARLAVVTADRQVQGRARHRGAQVVSPLAFLARCRRER